jgi:NAD(P)-dependent dehydrogenase (short-subunit alcohol dehydrogenase family)
MPALDERIALVTGAGRGYGAQAAHALLNAGAWVCVADLNPDRVTTIQQALTEQGGEAAAVQGDVSNKFQAANMIETTRDQFDGLHILIMNAHVSPHDDILTMDEWNWRRSLEVNVTGAFFTAQLAARVMTDENGGDIVFLLQPAVSAATRTARGALRGLAKGMRAELATQNVRVHLIDLETTSDFEDTLITLLTS